MTGSIYIFFFMLFLLEFSQDALFWRFSIFPCASKKELGLPTVVASITLNFFAYTIASTLFCT